MRNIRWLSSCIYVGALALTLISLSSCSSTPKVLSVKSFPAEADVCLKGKSGSEYLDSNKAVCIGQTPFEADHFDYVSSDGKKHHVEFRDLKPQENFYLILKKDGYASQSTQVPSWDQVLSLNQVQQQSAPLQVQVQAAPAPIASVAPIAQIQSAENEHGKTAALRILSNPPGALVYINGSLQGNTPYVYQYPINPGQALVPSGIKVKLEAPGFGQFERIVSLNSADNQEINFQLNKDETPQRIPASVMNESTVTEEELSTTTAGN
jgi:hypothetical protein